MTGTDQGRRWRRRIAGVCALAGVACCLVLTAGGNGLLASGASSPPRTDAPAIAASTPSGSGGPTDHAPSTPRSSLSDYAVRHWDTDDGLPSHTISDIRQAPDGYLWIATTAGLIRFDGHRFVVFDQRNAGLSNPRIARIHFLPDGGICVRADDASFMESRTTASPHFSPSAISPQDDYQFLGPDEARSRALARSLVKPPPGWTARLVDRFGNVWLHSEDAVQARRPDGSALWSRTFSGGTRIAVVTEDTEGDIWIGTVTDGLYRIRPVAFRVYGEESGIEDTGIFDAAPSDDGSVFLVSAQARPYRLHEGRALPTREGDVSTYRDRRGEVWTLRARFGPHGETGTEVLGPTGPDGGRSKFTISKMIGVLHLFEPENGSDAVWGRDATHVYRFARNAPPGAVLDIVTSAPEVRDAMVDRSGALWVASSEGLTRIHGRERVLFTLKEGLPTNRVRSLHEDADGALWIGTYGGGIVRMREGRFQTLDESRGLAENVVNTILEDAVGNFWMSGNRGIHRASRKQLASVLDGRSSRLDAILYGRPAGLTNPESSGHAGVSDASGRYWFPTFYGLACLDPREALALESTPIPVPIEGVRSLPQAAASGGHGEFWIPPGQSSLEIDYTAVTLRDPENVRFQYLLEGYDSEWVEAGRRRTANFTRLPPGSYRFRVRAFVTPGRWIEAASPVSLVVMPAFHQTRWFQALVAAALIAAAFLFYQVRTGFLRRRAARLEATVGERTQELAREKETVARQVEQLQELERAKNRFFANVSHEFRTPLTLIQGPLEDVQHGLHGEISRDVREQLDVATRSSHRLLHLVDQLLEVARAESGRLSLRARRGDYRLFLRRAAWGLAPLAERKGIELTVEAPDEALPLWFDPEHLEKVLHNVIGNALKFTPSGGHVRVTVTEESDDLPEKPPAPSAGSSRPESGWLVTRIEDDGPGISEEDLPKIFDRFHRGGSGRSQPGAGIGLALARELVSLHDGTIAAASREGHGSVFTIRLPRGRAHLAESDLAPEDEADLLRPVGGTREPGAGPASTSKNSAPHAAAASAGLAEPAPRSLHDASPGDPLLREIDLSRPASGRGEPGPTAGAAPHPIRPTDLPTVEAPPPGTALDADHTTVLIADDNEEVRRYVRSHLERRYRVLEASDGREALALTRRALPDLVVSDVMMPAMDGMELCHAIKNDPELDFLPVILLTARASTDSRVEGLGVGADDYLTKPFNVRELDARIRNLIESRRRLKLRFSGGGARAFTIAPETVKLESADRAFLDQVRDAVGAHLGEEELDADMLAKAVGASRATLYRRLGTLLGQSPMGLIRRARLEQAAALLARGEGSIGEIAYAVGFRSVAHFSAIFKEQYGSTPTAYRRMSASTGLPES
jgi:signal transduction histidine kinase/DNA-binding response OmpR family regulator